MSGSIFFKFESNIWFLRKFYRVLVLMWTLGALLKPGAITRSEFYNGMKKHKKYDIAGIKSMLPSLDPGFLEKAQFRGKNSMHKYTSIME